MRNLASIQKIVDIQPIIGADKIELCQVLGWKCIIGKADNLHVNDLCIYVEIDSRLDNNNPKFNFMEKRHFKVKTIKFSKFNVISQGLVLPISVLDGLKVDIKEGVDVTEELKITKIDTYEPGETNPASIQNPIDRFFCRFRLYRILRKYIKHRDKGWPSCVPHTDEIRAQAIWGVLQEAFKTKTWYVTTKIDGQSATFYYKPRFFKSFFGLYSRELRKKIGDNSNWSKVAEKYHIYEAMKDYGRHCFIQGEIAGPGIQKNKDHFMDLRLFIFNIYDFYLKRYLTADETEHFCNEYILEMVPYKINSVSLNGCSIDQLVEMSKGISQWSPDDLREGIVIRENEDLSFNRISFKVVNPDFLLKYGV